jgi:hypothetical protein
LEDDVGDGVKAAAKEIRRLTKYSARPDVERPNRTRQDD